ncbi:Dabb family protein [Flavihumibacter sp. R14]|nr:Dabb family protein [Flavihumibacter soli]
MKNLLILLSAVFVTGIGSNALAQDKKSDNKEFVHTVYFWLKNPQDQTDRLKFEKSLKTFINSSEYIKTKHLGTPAATNRDVIDRSWTYCLSLTFKSKADQDLYQAEEKHLVFIRESEMLWKKVLVYDSESIL